MDVQNQRHLVRVKPIKTECPGRLARLGKRLRAARTRRWTILCIPDPDKPARRFAPTALSLFLAGMVAAAAAGAIGFRIADYEAQQWALRRERSAAQRLLAEREALVEELERQQERLVELTLDVQRLQGEIEVVQALRDEIERLLAEGPAAVSIVVGSSDFEPSEVHDGAGGADLSANELRIWLQQEIGQTAGDVHHLAESMEGLRSSVLDFNDRLERTPSIWPAQGRVSSVFGPRVHPITGGNSHHDGIDIAAPAGTPVRATAAGTVALAGSYGGYGLAVVIDHGYGLKTLYAHNSRLAVQAGQRVNKGDLIAYVGSTGVSTGPHLHYEVIKDGKPIDPAEYLP